MATLRTLLPFATLLVAGCGADDSGNFLSDANVCRPLLTAYAEEPALDAAETPVPVAPALAQKTEPASAWSEHWGVELRLAATETGTSKLALDVYVGSDASDQTLNPPDTLPDDRRGRKVFSAVAVMHPTDTAPAWQRVRFDRLLTREAGEYAWLVLHSDAATNAASAAWQTVPGTGFMAKTATSGAFENRVNAFARYRFVDCE